MNPYKVVEDFEAALCEYTGARFAVTTNSCTMALLLALDYHRRRNALNWVEIPRRTYVGVAMTIKNLGMEVRFNNENWLGNYQLRPFPIWDSARYLSTGMMDGTQDFTMACLSFHWSKHLGIQQGGAILHNDREADDVLRRMRFDGRDARVPPKFDRFPVLGWHCYMSPEIAAEGLVRLSLLPPHNDPLPNSDYPDLSKLEIFK